MIFVKSQQTSPVIKGIYDISAEIIGNKGRVFTFIAVTLHVLYSQTTYFL